MPSMTERGLYDRTSAAEYLSTTARRIDELRRGGQLPAAQDGREWKFRRVDLDDYIDRLPQYIPGGIHAYTPEQVAAAFLMDLGLADPVRWLREHLAAGDVPSKCLNRKRGLYLMTDRHIEQWLAGEPRTTAPLEPVPVTDTEDAAVPGDLVSGLSDRARRRLRVGA